MSVTAEAIRVIDEWYAGLDVYQDRLPAKGTIAAALHVLQRLRTDYTLDISAHVAGGEAQITGLSATAIKKILAAFGETRVLSAVGGRSNRGARGDIGLLLDAMQPLRLERQSAETRDTVLVAMQQHIVTEYVSRFFAAKRVKSTFDPASATEHFIEAILMNARESGKAGPVAEYLVGAKLSLRFPGKEIRNKRFSTSDVQGGFWGDFEIGDTAFHVTVAPMPELYVKLKQNLEQGKRVYLLVPRSQVVGAEQNATAVGERRIAVRAIESFVATNIDELTDFEGGTLKSGFRRFLERYNERVDAVEHDKSMLIEIPANLD